MEKQTKNKKKKEKTTPSVQNVQPDIMPGSET